MSNDINDKFYYSYKQPYLLFFVFTQLYPYLLGYYWLNNNQVREALHIREVNLLILNYRTVEIEHGKI